MEVEVFQDVDQIWSKWHGQCCPMCREGMLSDGVRYGTKEIAGVEYKYKQVASWCDTCGDGVIINNPIKEVPLEEFLEAQRLQKLGS
jgi:hypothetical protein